MFHHFNKSGSDLLQSLERAAFRCVYTIAFNGTDLRTAVSQLLLDVEHHLPSLRDPKHEAWYNSLVSDIADAAAAGNTSNLASSEQSGVIASPAPTLTLPSRRSTPTSVSPTLSPSANSGARDVISIGPPPADGPATSPSSAGSSHQGRNIPYTSPTAPSTVTLRQTATRPTNPPSPPRRKGRVVVKSLRVSAGTASRPTSGGVSSTRRPQTSVPATVQTNSAHQKLKEQQSLLLSAERLSHSLMQSIIHVPSLPPAASESVVGARVSQRTMVGATSSHPSSLIHLPSDRCPLDSHYLMPKATHGL